MASVATTLTQSHFYSPAFNAAIFDGPLRIYFSQHQEAAALKTYFIVQEKFQKELDSAKNKFRKQDNYVFVMLYPSAETFDLCFEHEASSHGLLSRELGQDVVLGTSAPFEDKQLEDLSQEIQRHLKSFAFPTAPKEVSLKSL